MKIAAWNVNSVRAREERLLRWLEARRPDVLCLQELKAEEPKFPLEKVEALGYRAAVYGQQTYNGVAILAREAPADVVRGFADGEAEDPQSRLLAATVGGVRVISAYFPNGSEVGSEKYAYKLAWMKRLRAYLGRLDPKRPLALCGDFNVAPEARDVAEPAAWEGSVLFNEEVRGALAELAAWGLADAFRLHHEEGGHYSWWDYQRLSFPRNDGLRIDHVYVTAPLAARCTGASIDRDERKGPKPSDHAPVTAEFEG